MLNKMIQLENDLSAFIATHPGLMILMVAGNPFDDYSDASLIATIEDYERDGATTDATRKRFQDATAEAQSRGLFRSAGRRSSPNAMDGATPGRTTPLAYGQGARIGAGPDGDFRGLGDFAMAVKAAGAPGGGGHIDPRLIANAPSTVSTEGVGADGGFAVPPEYRTEIWKKVNGEASLLALTDQNITGSNQIVVPADEHPPWSSDGPQAYFESEGGQLDQSKVKLSDKTIRLNKLTALIPVTSELQEDAPGLDAYLRRKVGEVFNYKLNLKIARGTGAGEPLGFLNSPALKSVAAESGQGADTLLFANIVNMYSALNPADAAGAVWLANPDTRPQLLQLEYPAASGMVMPVFLPGQNLAGRPFGSLLGLPILFNFAMPPLGDQGDIVLASMKQYMTALKSGGMRSDVSMHLWFDYDVLAYRFILRIAGQPWPAAPITAPDGSTTYGSFVCLDERAG
jgi:HK97 family phage major capsid protein